MKHINSSKLKKFQGYENVKQWFSFHFVVDIDDCKESPCNNGGKCQDGVASYTCICPLGYTGPDCEKSRFIHIT